MMRFDPALDCDLCFESNDYRRSDHGTPVLVRHTDTMYYDDGTSAPYSDIARWCPCCIAQLSARDDITVEVLATNAA